ncbi:MAG: PAS domain S-box protein [Candidatus Scalindua sp.]
MEKKNNSHSQNETDEKRVMIVDDNRDFANSLFDILESSGFIVETAYSKKEACKKIRDFDAHLALIDVRLGHSSGISLIPEFKSANPGILCVMTTAYADIDTSIQALKEGAYDYLQKPIEAQKLLVTIDRCFEKIQLEAEKSAAEKALRESEERYRAFVTSNLAGMWCFDLSIPMPMELSVDEQIKWILGKSILAECNDVYAHMYGFPSASECIGRSLNNIWGVDEKIANNVVRDWISNGYQFVNYETVKQIPNGEYKYFLNMGSSVFKNNRLVRVWGTQTDITERKLAEQELEEVNKKLRIEIVERTKAEETSSIRNSFLKILQVAAVSANVAVTIKDAFGTILNEVCHYTGWPIGHVYMISKDNPDLLVPTDIWYLEEDERYAVFREITANIKFERSRGLPGRVLASGKPYWIVNVTRDPDFARAADADRLGLKSAFAFPVMVGKEIVSVLEFFSIEEKGPDNVLLSVMADVGVQLGRVIERKRSESAHRKSELRFRTLVENIPGVVYRCKADSNWTMHYISDMIEVVSGYPASDFIANSVRSFDSIIHPDDRDMVSDVVLKALTQRKSFSIEYRIITTDEGIKWIIERGQGIFAEDGQVQFLDGALFDITESKKADETLQLVNEQLQISIDQMPVGYILCDREYRVLEWNHVAEKIFGYSKSEVLGKIAVNFIVPEKGRQQVKEVIETLQKGEPLSYSEKDNNIRKDGKLISCQWYNTPLKDRSGKTFGILSMVEDITKRKQAEEMLQKSEEKYRRLIENLQDNYFFYVYNTEGIFTYTSPSLTNVLGYSAEEFLTHYSEYLTDNPINEEVIKYTKLSIKGNRPPPYEVEIYHKDGSIRSLQVQDVPLLGSDGKIESVEGIAKDITMAKNVEQERRQIYDQLKLSIEQMPIGYILWNSELRVIEWNHAAEQIFRYSKNEVLGEFATDLIVPEGDSQQISKILVLLKTEFGSYTENNNNIRKDGKLISCQWYNTLLKGKSGEVIGILSMVEDITQRKKAEKSLRESETRFRRLSQEFHTLLDAIDEPLILLSPELKILWANHGAETQFGKNTSDLNGKLCYKLWFNNSTPCERCPSLKCFRTGEVGNTQFSTSDNRLWDVRVFPVKDEKNKIDNVIVIASDITEEMTLQEESIRASQLASLGELAASVAHEINNPIYGITMCAQALLLESRDNKVKDSDIAKMILKESDRIANVTRCLLSFVRDSGDAKSLCNIHEIIADTLTITGVIMRKEGIDIRIQIPEDLPEILAYPQRIQQVFLNLLNNARYTLNEKYPDTNENKIIEITGRKIMIDGCPYNQIIFYDRGMGIASDKIDNILNPFFTTKPRGKGTGLGLSICNKFIKDHDGKIEIDSVEGEFTKIIISLPVATHKNQKTTKNK